MASSKMSDHSLVHSSQHRNDRIDEGNQLRQAYFPDVVPSNHNNSNMTEALQCAMMIDADGSTSKFAPDHMKHGTNCDLVS